jgi:hypothetical protein
MGAIDNSFEDLMLWSQDITKSIVAICIFACAPFKFENPNYNVTIIQNQKGRESV